MHSELSIDRHTCTPHRQAHTHVVIGAADCRKGVGCTTQFFFWILIGHEFAFCSDILPLNHISSALKILNRDAPSPKDSARHSRRAHGPGNVDSGFLSKIKVRPSPARLGFWNLNSGPTDSNPSKSRAEFGWGQNSAPRAEQNSGGLRSCEGEDLSSAHLGFLDEPTKSTPRVGILDSGFWILDSGFWILDFCILLAMHASSAHLDLISTNLASICAAG